MESIRGHWPAIENWTHYRRDVTLGEGARRTANRTGAEVLVSPRDLANGLYELERARERTAVDALATVLMVLGPDAGHALAVREGLPCLFILRGEGWLSERMTPGFEKLLRR